jgi:hypothetical protein
MLTKDCRPEELEDEVAHPNHLIFSNAAHLPDDLTGSTFHRRRYPLIDETRSKRL